MEGSFVRAGATGFEPAISALTGPHVSRYTTPPNFQKFIIFKNLRQGDWGQLAKN
jgi:hypothetical protein